MAVMMIKTSNINPTRATITPTMELLLLPDKAKNAVASVVVVVVVVVVVISMIG